MICAENLSKYYGEFRALNDISFDIGKGEIVGFLGRNGTGKTTTMRILSTYISASSGKVSVGGFDVKKDSLKVRNIIGYLPENPPLYLNMKVVDYLKFSAQLKEIPAKLHKAQIDRVISECNIEEVKDKVIYTLSKGFKQRVGIAQAIINEPAVLILDEPTSGLDPIQVQQVRELIKNLECERTVVLSTHILSEIEQIAKRVLILKEGRIVADDLLMSLLRDKKDKRKVLIRLKGYESAVEDAFKKTNSLKQIDIENKNGQYMVKALITGPLNNYNELVERLLVSGAEILEIKNLDLTLEEVFTDIDRQNI